MATKIKTLEQGKDIILPRTVSSAVTMEDGTNLEFAMKNRTTDHVKIPAEVAEALGLVEGSDLSDLLVRQANNTANVLAAAEVIN